MRGLTLSLLASAIVAISAPAAHAGQSCKWIPSWCPAQSDPDPGNSGHHDHSVPEPGTLGLLVMGAAASIGMLRRKKR